MCSRGSVRRLMLPDLTFGDAELDDVGAARQRAVWRPPRRPRRRCQSSTQAETHASPQHASGSAISGSSQSDASAGGVPELALLE